MKDVRHSVSRSSTKSQLVSENSRKRHGIEKGIRRGRRFAVIVPSIEEVLSRCSGIVNAT